MAAGAGVAFEYLCGLWCDGGALSCVDSLFYSIIRVLSYAEGRCGVGDATIMDR